MKHKNGNWVWVHDRGRVITRTEDGKPLTQVAGEKREGVKNQLNIMIGVY
jgi:hypothetical protein